MPSPAMVSAVPDSYPQGTSTQFSADGGYYGGGNSPLVNLLFNGTLNLATRLVHGNLRDIWKAAAGH